MLKVISLGGSVITGNDQGFDIEFLKKFALMIKNYIDEDPERKLILVAGGGRIAREYQNIYKQIVKSHHEEEADRLGIAATQVNARLLKAIFREHCKSNIISNPNIDDEISSPILVAGGWKPGFSTDYNAVMLAKKFKTKKVINLSNIKKVYDKDPKIHSDAIPLTSLKWVDYLPLINDKWEPGLSSPFDPIASRLAEENDMQVIIADGFNLENTKKILYNANDFEGTTLSN